MSSLDGSVTLITGAAGALARPVVDAFAAAGSRIVLADLVAPDAAAAHVGGVALQCDLLNATSAAAAVGRAAEVHGRLDHVLHLVGGFSWQPAHEASDADYDRLFDLNVRSLFNVGRAALPILRARGQGLLAGVSSGQAWRGAGEGVALYAASKAAVATWLRSVDLELGGTDVKVAILYPMGVIDTPANRASMPDADPAGWIDPVDLAAALVFAASTTRRGRMLELPVHPGR
jgi:NAD(P)-dependent dehydrogenase (short-subunit alcohol dehydrogenase family)